MTIVRVLVLVTIVALYAFVNSSLNPAPFLQGLDAIWPVPEGSRSEISSTFGPRLQFPEFLYDFHRGIDISAATGTNVQSILPGTLHGTANYSSEGLTVIIRHQVSLTFHGKAVQYLYAFYMHLNGFSDVIKEASKYDAIAKGAIIGFVGKTGSAVQPHLYFEARLGSECSLVYQLENPNSPCSFLMQDPHIHPLGLFSKPTEPEDRITLTVEKIMEELEGGAVTVQAPCEWPLANRFELRSEPSGKSLAALDLSLRVGFNATTVTQLDTPDMGKPFIMPLPFYSSSTIWKVTYIIPASFENKGANETWVLYVTDVFDEVVATEVAPKGTILTKV